MALDVADLYARARYKKSTGCQIWNGPRSRAGAPLCEIAGRRWLVHRAVWTARRGAIPRGKRPFPGCGNILCIEERHLALVAGGRAAAAVGAHAGPRRLKLRDDQVRSIRAAEGSHAAIARRFLISRSHVTNIKNGARKSLIR